MFVLEIAWEIITDFAAELIEGPDKERVRMCLAFVNASMSNRPNEEQHVRSSIFLKSQITLRRTIIIIT